MITCFHIYQSCGFLVHPFVILLFRKLAKSKVCHIIYFGFLHLDTSSSANVELSSSAHKI